MLNEHAEQKIKLWLTSSITTIKLFLKAHEEGKAPDWRFLDSAIEEEKNLSCFYSVYHSTISKESFDPSLHDEIQALRNHIQSLRPLI